MVQTFTKKKSLWRPKVTLIGQIALWGQNSAEYVL